MMQTIGFAVASVIATVFVDKLLLMDKDLLLNHF